MQTFREWVAAVKGEKLRKGFHETDPDEEAKGTDQEGKADDEVEVRKKRKCSHCGKAVRGQVCPSCGY